MRDEFVDTCGLCDAPLRMGQRCACGDNWRAAQPAPAQSAALARKCRRPDGCDDEWRCSMNTPETAPCGARMEPVDLAQPASAEQQPVAGTARRWLAVGAGGDTVRLLPVGDASVGPDVFVRLAECAAPPALPQDADIDVECETCDGRGTIDERLGGYGDSNPAAKCPDCDGAGWWRRRTAPPALHEAALRAAIDACEKYAHEIQTASNGEWGVALECARRIRALRAAIDAARRDGGEG